MTYINRYIGEHIKKLSETFPVILLTGARQVGKTTLLKHLSSLGPRLHHYYVSLDEFELRQVAKNDPGLFLQRHPAPLIIDEIQYAPELLSYIKVEVDRSKKMGMYWLTGSQQFHLMKNVSESLAGRIAIIKMHGISQAEAKNIPLKKTPWTPDQKEMNTGKRYSTVLEIFEKIIKGSFPRLFDRNAPPLDSFYGSYIQTYIERDLRDLMNVHSISKFEKFIQVCAARTATVLNISDLARDSDISVNTAKEWLSLLETSFQIFFLKPYYKNFTKRLIKAPKLYFLDTGLVSYITGWRDPVQAAKGAFAGQLFETFVIGEILKSYWHRGTEPRIFYYRTKEKKEIDVIIEKNGKILPAEIKLSSLVRASDMKTIYHLEKTGFNVGKSVVIAATRQPYPLEKNISIIPVEAIM